MAIVTWGKLLDDEDVLRRPDTDDEYRGLLALRMSTGTHLLASCCLPVIIAYHPEDTRDHARLCAVRLLISIACTLFKMLAR